MPAIRLSTNSAVGYLGLAGTVSPFGSPNQAQTRQGTQAPCCTPRHGQCFMGQHLKGMATREMGAGITPAWSWQTGSRVGEIPAGEEGICLEVFSPKILGWAVAGRSDGRFEILHIIYVVQVPDHCRAPQGCPASGTVIFLLGKLRSPGHVLEKRNGDELHGEVLLYAEERASGHLNPAEEPSSSEDIVCQA